MKFKPYNNNPYGLNVSDCAIRAIAKAENKSWEEIYKSLYEIGFKSKKNIQELSVIQTYLFKDYTRKEIKPTPITKLKFKGEALFLVRTSGEYGRHLVYVNNGEYYDTYELTEKDLVVEIITKVKKNGYLALKDYMEAYGKLNNKLEDMSLEGIRRLKPTFKPYELNKKLKDYKFDNDKLMLNLIPPSTIDALGRVLTYGANKYKPNSWQTVNNAIERYTAALQRHLNEFRKDNNSVDEESGLRHIEHILANASFLEYLTKK